MRTFVRPMPMQYDRLQDADAAVEALGIRDRLPISLKLRPVKWNDDKTELWDAYVYPSEYARAYALLDRRGATRFALARQSDRSRLLTDPSGERALVIEHETGPEVVATLAVIAAALGLAKEAFAFLKELLKAVNDANEAKRKADKEALDRYYLADAVSLEARLRGQPQLLSGLNLPVVNEEEFDKFLLDGLQRLKTHTEWDGSPNG